MRIGLILTEIHPDYLESTQINMVGLHIFKWSIVMVRLDHFHTDSTNGLFGLIPVGIIEVEYCVSGFKWRINMVRLNHLQTDSLHLDGFFLQYFASQFTKFHEVPLFIFFSFFFPCFKIFVELYDDWVRLLFES